MLGVRRRGFSTTALPSAGALSAIGNRPVLALDGTGGALSILNPVVSLFSATPAIQYPPASSQSHWRHRRCPEGIPFEIPLTARWGAFPYNWSVTGPSGMGILYTGYDVMRPPYAASLYWASPTLGSHTITVVCTDQFGISTSVQWTLEVADADDTTKFMFLSQSGSNGAAGTQGSPKQTMAAWLEGDENSSTYQNVQIFYEDGTYNIGGLSGVDYDSAGRILTMNPNKPKTHVGLGSSVIWNSNGCCWNYDGGATGAFISNVRWLAAEVDFGIPANFHIRESGGFTNGAAFKITFVGGSVTTGESANASCMLLNQSPGSARGNIVVSQCVYENIRYQQFIKLYDALDITQEGCVATGTMSEIVVPLHPKGGNLRRILQRGNDFGRVEGFGGTTGLSPMIEEQWINIAVGDRRDDFEVCWNSIRTPGLLWKAEGGDGGLYGTHHSYRNNCQGDNHQFRNADASVFTFNRDIIQHSGSFTNGIDETGTGSPTVTNIVSGTSGLLHASTNLRVAANAGYGCQMEAA
jgi:hypothetical protein